LLQNRLSTGPLWWDWAELEWLSEDPEAAIRVVLLSADLRQAGTGIIFLRAKRILEDTVTGIPTPLWKVREAWSKLGMLLELLTSPSGDVSLPLGSDLTRAGTVAEESMAVASLSMLYHHIVTLRNAARPTVLRQRLEQAVVLYPNNTIIVGMFLEMQKGQSVWGRVRDLLSTGETNDPARIKCVARRIVDVWIAGWEKGRWNWEIERTRSGLATAVEDERYVVNYTSDCPWLELTAGINLHHVTARGEARCFGESLLSSRFEQDSCNERRAWSSAQLGSAQ